MAITRSAFSKVGLPFEATVDVGALSDRAQMRTVIAPVVIGTAAGGTATAYFVINVSTDHPIGCLAVPGTLVAASYCSDRVVSLGTGSVSVYAATTDGTTKTLLTNTLDPETLTANVGVAWTIAATNRALLASDVLFLRCTADNNAVATDARNVKITLVFTVTETDPPTR